MATKKQRSRRAKTFRHEYGFVKYDDEGNEIEVSGAELRGKTADDPKAPAKETAAKSTAPQRGVPNPPSWERAMKRGGLTGAGLALLMVFLLHAPIALGLVYGVMFIPLTYWMEGMTYRWYQKRQAKATAAPDAKKPGRKPASKQR